MLSLNGGNCFESMKKIAIFALSGLLISALTTSAKESQPVRQTLGSVPAPELPAKSAELVKKAKARDWGKTTVSVVNSAVEINPAATPAVVGAISKSVPDMAATAAGTAATQQPKQAAAITKAAVAAAPSKVSKIVAAVTRAVPAEYRSISVAAAEVAPTAGKEILAAVGSAIPELKMGVEKSLATYNVSGAPAVAMALDKAAAGTQTASVNNATAAGPLPKGPTVGAPFLPLSGSPTAVTPATGQDVPPGGRDYSAP